MRNASSSPHTKTQRIDIRATSKIKHTLMQAAELSGVSVSQFLLIAACEKAENIIQTQENLRLTNLERDRLLKLLENPPKPNAKLKKAMQAYLESRQL